MSKLKTSLLPISVHAANSVNRHFMRKLIMMCILLLIARAGYAQAPVPAPLQQQPIALTGATIHTMAGEVIENGTLLFQEGVITALGTSVSLPDNAVVEDLSGKHIYPGLRSEERRVGKEWWTEG